MSRAKNIICFSSILFYFGIKKSHFDILNTEDVTSDINKLLVKVYYIYF